MARISRLLSRVPRFGNPSSRRYLSLADQSPPFAHFIICSPTHARHPRSGYFFALNFESPSDADAAWLRDMIAGSSERKAAAEEAEAAARPRRRRVRGGVRLLPGLHVQDHEPASRELRQR